MSVTQVRVNESTHKLLRSLSAEVGETMQTIVEKAVEDYRRRNFLESLNQDFKALKEDEAVWEEELSERGIWEATLLDGDEK